MKRLRLPQLFLTRHVLFALIAGGAGGVLFMVLLLEFDHFTSTAAFCTTCHSMELAEDDYRRSVHYNPPSGVRADCGHCHVSEGIFAATWDHVKGTKDLIKQVKGQLVGPNYDDPVINALHAPEAAFAARAQASFLSDRANEKYGITMDFARCRTARDVDHHEQFHQVIVDRRRQALHDKDHARAHTGAQLDVEIIVAEARDQRAIQRQPKMVRHLSCQRPIRTAAENSGLRRDRSGDGWASSIE